MSEPFRFSTQLTDLMRNAARDLAQIETGCQITDADLPHETLQENGWNQFRGALAELAYFASLDQQTTMVLSAASDRFSIKAANRINRHIHVNTHDQFTFASLLHEEVSKHLASGGEIKIPGGKMELRDGRLVLKIEPVQS